MPTLTPITDAQLAQFFVDQGLNPPSAAETARIQALSFSFLCALPWCPDAVIDQDKFNLAQGLLIHAMTEAGGGFDPLVIQDGRDLKRKNIGRTAIEKEWFDKPDNLNGTSPIYLLRQLSIPYGLLSNWLCPELEEKTVSGGCGPLVF